MMGIKSSASLSTSILIFVSACQNAGSTSEENGWNCMMVMVVVVKAVREQGEVSKPYAARRREWQIAGQVPQPKNP